MTAVILIGVLYVGTTVHGNYYWGLCVLPVPVGAYVYCSRKETFQKKLAFLREQWGQVTDRKRDFTDISSLYQCEESHIRDSGINDQTWADLHMDEVYTRMDNTLTSPGQSVLYRILRTPLYEETPLQQRSQLFQLFQTNQTLRESLQLELLGLDRERQPGITSLVWQPAPPVTGLRHIYTGLALVALLALGLGYYVFGLSHLIILVLPVYLVNLVITNALRKHYLFYLSSIRYLGDMIHVARSIADRNVPGLEHYSQPLKTAAMACESLARRTFLLRPEDSVSSDLGAFLYGHINIYFLREVRIFYAVANRLQTCRQELQTVYSLLGELDALISVASYRQQWEDHLAEPQFTDQDNFMEVRDLVHPLMTDPVPNSLTLVAQGVTVTGSNMAGKTTFLRTLGVNAILAQTIYITFGSFYRTRFFHVLASLSEHDDLLAAKSYYLAEAENLLRMVKAARQDSWVLCLVDEPLAGTNSLERIAASQEILRYLIKHHAVVFATTHDLGLARALEPDYQNTHFTDEVGSLGLQFDYKLRPGIATTTNALKLLDYLNYPSEIVAQANQRLKTMHRIRSAEGKTQG
ncbi:hypothetical protein ACFL6U_01615 [Planctomycetota bacterium]